MDYINLNNFFESQIIIIYSKNKEKKDQPNIVEMRKNDTRSTKNYTRESKKKQTKKRHKYKHKKHPPSKLHHKEEQARS